MNGPNDTTSSLSVLPTPRTSLQNIGEKHDKDEEGRNVNSFQAFGADGFTFLDFLDVINPLHHIPLVGALYREITGDEIDPGSRIAGGTLFGGPIGAAVSMVDVAIEQSSGQDMGEHMMTLFDGGEADDGVILANTPPAATAAGVVSEEIAEAVSPITVNAEVLEWAQREAARTSGGGDQARLKAQSVGSTDIVANIEVLNWARQEASLSRADVETADATTLDKRQLARRLKLEDSMAALDKSIALGRDQSQLTGATAPLGGWFSETMLLALARYGDTAKLAGSTPERHVEEVVNSSE